QTPQQRRANEKFAKHESAKRGKSKTTVSKQSSKPSLPIGWVALLAFVVCGGLIFELLRIIPELWSATASLFNRLMG
ncbi:hypothetical protein P175DRAFT_0440487, partial [Aspergillus ochraceoroseus IBT 24754]